MVRLPHQKRNSGTTSPEWQFRIARNTHSFDFIEILEFFIAFSRGQALDTGTGYLLQYSPLPIAYQYHV